MIKTLLVFLALSSAALGREYVYQGQWVTQNRPLDGIMTAAITPVKPASGPVRDYTGRFFGVWQGVSFDYTVAFHGPLDKLVGTAMIDGASYEWKGVLTKDVFVANFGGDRYVGIFKLQRKK